MADLRLKLRDEDRERLNRRVVTRVLGTAQLDGRDAFDGRVARNIYGLYSTGQRQVLESAAEIGQ